ncbi:MAG: hypothetical protein OXT67_03575 [Zetaproteobacteria bacterium]|nr:hypothetical protein [Zetaproteobacteria bacterium]
MYSYIHKLAATGLSLSMATSAYAHPKVEKIESRFETVEEVHAELARQGLESSNMVVGIDFTKSNNNTGKKSYGGKKLHTISPAPHRNPYQNVIHILGRALHDFDDDDIIPAYGFGDIRTRDKSVFPISWGSRECEGFQQLEEAYVRYAQSINKPGGLRLSGPTSMVPLIKQAIHIVTQAGGYHILVVIADGSVTNYAENQQALIEASRYPLSVVIVGVGDGTGYGNLDDSQPFSQMLQLDDDVEGKLFDNVQFVNFSELWESTKELSPSEREAEFALEALMEIPDQYKQIKQLGLLDKYPAK